MDYPAAKERAEEKKAERDVTCEKRFPDGGCTISDIAIPTQDAFCKKYSDQVTKAEESVTAAEKSKDEALTAANATKAAKDAAGCK